MSKRFLIAIFFVCLCFFSAHGRIFALTEAEQRAEWQSELDQLNADIAKNQAILNSTKANTKTLQDAAAVLNTKIAQDKLLIKQKNIAIAQLDADIADKNASIANLEKQISDGHDSIAQMLRQINEIDQYSLPDIILSNQNLSEFFSDVETFQSVNQSLAALFVQVRATQNLTEQEKAQLQAKQDKETDTKVAAQQEQQKTAADEKQKEYLIAVSKSQEKTYAQVLADQQAKASQIRAKLFNLAGGSAAIPFGTALTYAQAASAATGVDPAFLLAIMTQESNLGANVGQCLLTNTSTGAGVGRNTGTIFSNVMKPSRDVPPFLDITSKLGLDPLGTPVSCPIAGVNGYGGAMGPAQFIASTWALLENRLQSALGHFANPWAAQDAFVASAIYLSDLGASGTSYSANIRAACKYYGTGGSSCSYGRSVMNLDSSIQSDITYLNDYGVSRR